MPLISVIVPVYNAELYLNGCICSITNQIFDDIEIILVDDGSTDNSLAILRDWEKKDSRIKVVHQQNSGVTIARQTGVRMATSDWITFVDADDELPPNALGSMYDCAKEADLVVGQVDYVGAGKWTFIVRDEMMSPIQYIRLMYSSVLHSVPFARLFKKEMFLDPFVFSVPKEITHGEDTIMNFRIATKCYRIRTIADVVYKYIAREGSASRQNKFASLSYCRLYEKNEWLSFPFKLKRHLYLIRYRTIYERRKLLMKVKIKTMLGKIGLI